MTDTSKISLGMNRWDYETPGAFADDVRTVEQMGYGHALMGVNAIRVWDTYIMLATAALRTERIRLATFVDNPVLRHPAVLANSIATVDQVSDGRAEITLGIGDTAVRFLGLEPQRVAEFERSLQTIHGLLAGESIEFGEGNPQHMWVARPVPVWVAAGGPRSLRAAGRQADGVYLRVGRHPANLRAAVEHVHAGAIEAGRDPASIKIGLVFHTIMSEDPADVIPMARSIAAGYYEYSTVLYDTPGLEWNGPPMHELREKVWPDFHHTDDLVGAGAVVDFLGDDVVESFACYGSPTDIAHQYARAIDTLDRVDVVVPHPVPSPPSAVEFADWFSQKVWPHV